MKIRTIEQPGAYIGDTKGEESLMRREESKVNRHKTLYDIMHRRE